MLFTLTISKNQIYDAVFIVGTLFLFIPFITYFFLLYISFPLFFFINFLRDVHLCMFVFHCIVFLFFHSQQLKRTQQFPFKIVLSFAADCFPGRRRRRMKIKYFVSCVKSKCFFFLFFFFVS